ncbi:MAG: hypothetical protein IJU48_04440 [Synergistaceae bacterium]|nr:hypothetical protein [Synergistaceae bacterium]
MSYFVGKNFMHNIAICSGNPEELTQLQNIIDDYEEFSNEDFTVKVFPSSEALTLAMKSYRPDILVIDAAGGIETVRNLRRENYTGEIIFTASNGEHALEAFDLEARQYFIRPINPQKFFRTLEKIMPPKKFIIVKQRRNIRKILCDEILYCETNGKHQEIYTFNEKITVRITAREMKKLAPPPLTVILPP